MTKEEKSEREKWKIEDAIRTFTEYQKIMEDKDLKEKAIKELEKRADEFKKTASELK